MESESFDFDSLKSRSMGMLRYTPLIAIQATNKLPTIRFGGTPLVPVPNISKLPFKGKVYIKNEGLNPSGSMKDRAAAITCLKARERGSTVVAAATSGNAGAAISLAANSLGLDCKIFIPKDAPPAKKLQAQLYGADLYLVDGEYDDAVDIAKEACKKNNWFSVTQDNNRWPIEGMKTVAFEICDQLTDVLGYAADKKWQAPSVVICPVGEGCVVSALYLGLVELYNRHIIDKLPRIIGVQAVGSNSLTICWNEHNGDPEKIPTVEINTIADSLACRYPQEGAKALEAIKNTNGTFYDATNEELLAAMYEMSTKSGCIPEPASVTAWVGLTKALDKGEINGDDTVVLICTGNGIKDLVSLKKAADLANPCVKIQPDANLDVFFS